MAKPSSQAVAFVVLSGAIAAGLVACNGGGTKSNTVVSRPSDSNADHPDLDGPPFFEDVTEASGVKFSYQSGEESKHMAILESLGGGGALIDYDGDGLLDLFLPGGGYYDKNYDKYKQERETYESKLRTNPKASPPARPQIHGHPAKLYRNLGNFKFEDVTEKVGLKNQPDFYTHGAAVCDYDRDGFSDLLVTGYGRSWLLHNESDGAGGRKFVDVTAKSGLLGNDPNVRSRESGQPGPHFWGTSAAWGDIDGDGLADLYICQYVNWSFLNDPPCAGYSTKIARDVCPPKVFETVAHALWKNNGNGTFTNASEEAGLRQKPSKEDPTFLGKGLGVLMIDVDGDQKPEIYVCNDTTDNFLYMNKSKPGKTSLEEKGLSLGVARDHNGVPNGSMGIDGADYDGSGRPSIWVTNYEGEYHALYRSLFTSGRLTFAFATPAAGLSQIGQTFVGFGTVFDDVNNDGWEDLIVTNGHVVHFPQRNNQKQRQIIFLNTETETKSGPQRKFIDASKRGGPFFQVEYRGRGLAIGDLNNDGVNDLVFVPVGEPVRIVKGLSVGNHWLGVDLRGKDRRDLVGTRITLEVGDRKITRFVKGGGSYLSAHDRRTIIGVGNAAKVGKLKVEWSSGEPRVQEWDNLPIDQYHTLEQK